MILMLTIEQKLRDILKNNFEDPEVVDNISLDDNLTTYQLNSVSFIKIIVEIENEFDIEFDDEEISIETFETLEDVIHCIERKVDAAAE